MMLANGTYTVSAALPTDYFQGTEADEARAADAPVFGTVTMTIPPLSVSATEGAAARCDVQVDYFILAVFAIVAARFSGAQVITAVSLDESAGATASRAATVDLADQLSVRQLSVTLAAAGGGEAWVPSGPFLVLSTGGTMVDLSGHEIATTIDSMGLSWVVTMHYRIDRFQVDTATLFLESFVTALHAAAADSQILTGVLPLLDEKKRQEMLWRWNERPSRSPSAKLIPELVQQQAITRRDCVAVVAGDQVVTYQALESRSNQLANLLHGLGVRRDTPVAVCLSCSAETVTTLLAVWKAGGFYVPLDPTHPAERRKQMIDTIGARVLISRDRHGQDVSGISAERLDLTAAREEIDAQSTAPPPPLTRPDDIAYAIFTSGSTGTPKAAQIKHRNLANVVDWYIGFTGMAPGDRSTMLASPAFDASVLEIWPTLGAGGELRVPDRSVVHAPASVLANWFIDNDIAVTCLPTPVAELLLGEPWPPTTPLKCLLMGGDRLRRWPPEGTPFRVINAYGPTECTVASTAVELDPTMRGSHRLPPIGRPISNATSYVLDERQQPVPVNVPGELYVGGDGVGHGYFEAKELTAQSFVADPFVGEPEARMFRTRDLVRWRPDGMLEFLGRTDRQVKIRGFRVEPAEVEAALRALPWVQDAAVLPLWTDDVGVQLIAYVSSPEGEAVPIRMRDELSRTFPAYMIPAHFVVLEELPVTPNGKLDRSALLLRVAADAEAGIAGGRTEDYLPPRTGTEARLIQLWEAATGIPRVGVLDDFFEIGGDSLRALRILTAIDHEFDVRIPIADLIDKTTVVAQASVIDHHLVVRSEQVDVPSTIII